MTKSDTVTHPAQGECRQQSRASTYPFPYPLPEPFSVPYMAPMRGSVGTPAKDRCSKPPVATANPAVLAPGGTCADTPWTPPPPELQDSRSEEHTSELQSRFDLVCRLL